MSEVTQTSVESIPVCQSHLLCWTAIAKTEEKLTIKRKQS